MSYQFQIVRGDFGRIYRGVIKDQNYSDCDAVIYVWDEDDVKIVDNRICVVSYVGSNTHVEFTPTEIDFDVPPGIYYGLFKLTKEDVTERTLRFTWLVEKQEPQD